MCEMKVCLNGASCSINPNSKMAECNCKKGYYGEACGRKNFCRKANKIACFNNGTCLINGQDNKPYCKIKKLQKFSKFILNLKFIFTC